MAHEAGGEGVAGRLVDEQEVAHSTAGGIVLDGEFGLGLDGDVGDVVHGDGLGIFHIGNAIQVQGAGDGGDAGLNQGRTVAQLEHLAGLNLLFGQAHNGGVEFAGGRGVLGPGEEIAAAVPGTTVVALDDAAHQAPLEQPVATAEALAAFLTTVQEAAK